MYICAARLVWFSPRAERTSLGAHPAPRPAPRAQPQRARSCALARARPLLRSGSPPAGLLPAETIPTEMRSMCHGFAAAVGKAGALVAGVVFGLVSDQGKFYISAFCGLAGVVCTIIFIPGEARLAHAARAALRCPRAERAWRSGQQRRRSGSGRGSRGWVEPGRQHARRRCRSLHAPPAPAAPRRRLVLPADGAAVRPRHCPALQTSPAWTCARATSAGWPSLAATLLTMMVSEGSGGFAVAPAAPAAPCRIKKRAPGGPQSRCPHHLTHHLPAPPRPPRPALQARL